MFRVFKEFNYFEFVSAVFFYFYFISRGHLFYDSFSIILILKICVCLLYSTFLYMKNYRDNNSCFMITYVAWIFLHKTFVVVFFFSIQKENQKKIKKIGRSKKFIDKLNRWVSLLRSARVLRLTYLLIVYFVFLYE